MPETKRRTPEEIADSIAAIAAELNPIIADGDLDPAARCRATRAHGALIKAQALIDSLAQFQVKG